MNMSSEILVNVYSIFADVAELADALDLGSSDQFKHSKKRVFMRFRGDLLLNRFFIFR